jgi:hypothetical protein
MWSMRNGGPFLEEGAENSILQGDPAAEASLSEWRPVKGET